MWSAVLLRSQNSGDDGAGALVEHWNGRAWSMVSGPQVVPLAFTMGLAGRGPRSILAADGVSGAGSAPAE